ncbi:MAG TPA: hypothetical protein VMA37_05545 [Acetobacteraceae bacterium]|nr:hypothetical protein [Acetobacteraceae bacterium]
MRKALLTGTAAFALGLFGFGVNSASALSVGLDNIPVAVSTSSGSATSVNKSFDGNTVGSYNHSGNGNLNGSGNGNLSHNDNGNLNGSGDGNLSNNKVGVATGSHSAASGTGNANSGDIDSHNSAAFTGSGGGVAAAGGGTALQFNGSGDIVAPGGLLSNGTLLAAHSFNHTDVDVTLATSSAGGEVHGGIDNDNGGIFGGGSAFPHNGAPVAANINGSTGVITQNVNAQGVAQFNTAVTAVGVDNTSTLFGH